MPQLLLLLLLWGCAAHTPKPNDFDLASWWWRLYGNEELAGMVERSFLHPSLRQITYQLEELQALKASRRSKLFPTLTLEGSKEGSVDADGERLKGYALALRVDFDPDLFAKNRDLLRSSAFETQAKQLELIAAKNEWAAQVVKDYIGYCAQKRKIELLRKKVALAKRYARLLFAYYLSAERGLGDYLVAQNEYVDTKEELARAKLLLQLFADALEYETHTVPTCSDLKEPPLPSIKLSDLEQRADLFATKLTLLAAVKRYENAKKASLPDLRLTSLFRMQDTTLADLVQSWIWSWSVSLGVKLFDRDLEAQRKIYKAKLLQRVEEYQDRMLQAIKELKDIRHQLERTKLALARLEQKSNNQAEELRVLGWRTKSLESSGMELLRLRMRRLDTLLEKIDMQTDLLTQTAQYLKSVNVVKEGQ